MERPRRARARWLGEASPGEVPTVCMGGRLDSFESAPTGHGGLRVGGGRPRRGRGGVGRGEAGGPPPSGRRTAASLPPSLGQPPPWGRRGWWLPWAAPVVGGGQGPRCEGVP